MVCKMMNAEQFDLHLRATQGLSPTLVVAV